MSRKPVDRSVSCDQEIEERLERLRSDTAETSDQKAIETRLARLKGIDPKVYTMPPITVYHNKHKTDQQKTDDLMKQLSEELAIDDTKRVSLATTRRLSTDDDIERRLARLRDQQYIDNKTNMDIDSDLDEETEQNNLVDRLLAEAKLPSIPYDANQETNEEDLRLDSDHLPWCEICNEDAVIKCIDCMGDLYCKECFIDFHDDSDLKKHRTEPFRAPKNQNESF